MSFLYNFFLTLLFPIIYFFLLFTKKGNLFLQNRKITLNNLANFFRKPHSKVYWFHAASVGELEQCKAVIEVIRSQEANSIIVQSVFSSSVTTKHLDFPLFDFAFYLPIDFFWAYDRLFQVFQPNFLIIAAWDTWFNLLQKAKQYNCKTFLICATLNPDSGRLKFPFSLFTKKIFSYIDFVLPANEIFFEEFAKLIPKTKIGISADSRFDAVINKIDRRSNFPTLPKSNKKIIIFASTYKEDEDILFTVLPEIINKFSIWIFPHKISEENLNRVKTYLKRLKLDYRTYSSLNSEDFEDIVLFDKLGILAYAYEKGFYAYVGGALHNRVHNVIEPAYFGLPIITGPKIYHSAEARVLKEKGGLFIVRNANEFQKIHFSLTEDLKLYTNIQIQNKKFVESMKGSSQKIFSFLKSQD